MRPMNMKNQISTIQLFLALHHRSDLQLEGATGFYQPARWAVGLFLGIRLQRHADRLRAGRHRRRLLQHHASTRADPDRDARTAGHGDTDEWSPYSGGQHVNSVSRLQRDDVGRGAGVADAGGSTRRNGDVHFHRHDARYTCLLQRNPGRSPDGDGLVWGDHCAAQHRPHAMYVRNPHFKRGGASCS